jgi:hypothetical protein
MTNDFTPCALENRCCPRDPQAYGAFQQILSMAAHHDNDALNTAVNMQPKNFYVSSPFYPQAVLFVPIRTFVPDPKVSPPDPDPGSCNLQVPYRTR